MGLLNVNQYVKLQSLTKCQTINSFIMEAKFTEESYALVLKMANKFAYGNTSIEYEHYVNSGTEGLIKAINNYQEGRDADFSTFATTCIRNAMCTRQTQLKRFNLQQDENVILDGDGEKPSEDGEDEITATTDNIFNSLTEEMKDYNVTEALKMVIKKVNKGNDRNEEMALLHFGLVDEVEKPMDYKELSARFNVSAERVRQVCVKNINAIKADDNLKDFLYAFVG